MTMTAKIKKAKKELADAKKEYTQFLEEHPIPKPPAQNKYKCPKCKAKPSAVCVTSSGHATGSHADRIFLISDDLDVYRKQRFDRQEKQHILGCNEDKLKLQLVELEKAAAQAKKVSEFVKRVSVVGKQNELSIEWDGYVLRVTKYRNLIGINLGMEVPDMKAAEALMKKGIDVTVATKKSHNIQSDNAWPYYLDQRRL